LASFIFSTLTAREHTCPACRRTGTGNDIITFVFLGMFVIAGLVSINYALLHYSPDINLRNLWISFYEVVQLSFQDGFPEPDDPDVQKLVAVGVASTGDSPHSHSLLCASFTHACGQ
jgi:hypothetical protein